MLALAGLLAACDDDDDSPFPGTDSATPLTDGTPVTISGGAGSFTLYSIAVPSGATELRVTTSGGTGDPDIYVSFAEAPTPTDRDCFSDDEGTVEECVFNDPATGTFYILVEGFEVAYSGVSLLAQVSP
jgi:hypothetical protein